MTRKEASKMSDATLPSSYSTWMADPKSTPGPSDFRRLANELDGSIHFDGATRTLYATDASVYREMPQAVAFPKTEEDIIRLIRFARDHGTALVPRTAGTSLA